MKKKTVAVQNQKWPVNQKFQQNTNYSIVYFGYLFIALNITRSQSSNSTLSILFPQFHDVKKTNAISSEQLFLTGD